jgi:hypothetical protein
VKRRDFIPLIRGEAVAGERVVKLTILRQVRD